MSKKSRVTVHLNETEKLELACTITNKISDVYSLVETAKGVLIDRKKFTLNFKDGLVANIDGRVNRDVELWFKPHFNLAEALEKKIFGKSIDEASKRAKKGLPTVLSICFKYLQTEKALKSPGIFRLAGERDRVKAFKAEFDENENTEFPEDLDPTIVGSLVIQYLLDLPESLTVEANFPKFLAVLKSDQKIKSLTTEIKAIPTMNQKILQFIIRYLVYMVKYTADNKSTSTNIATVMGPILFRTKDGKEKNENAKDVCDLVKLLIDNYYEAFGVEKKEEAKSEQKTEMKSTVTTNVGLSKEDSFKVTPEREKVVDPTKKAITENVSDHWQQIIEQWKERYQKEVADRKNDKQVAQIRAEQLDLQVDTLQKELDQLKDSIKHDSRLKDAERTWLKKERDLKDDLDRKDREIKDIRDRMENEILELKKKHHAEMQKKMDIEIDDSIRNEPKIVRNCAQCKKNIPTEDFMESGAYFYHDDCFKCTKCQQLIDGPFKNNEGVLMCKPCSEKKDDPMSTSNTMVTKVICGGCNLEIVAGHPKLKAIDRLYHSECFKCQKCKNDFIDKKFFNLNGVPVCKNCKTAK